MNLICAYCGVQFVDDHQTASRRAPARSAACTWGIFAAALVLPIVGLIAGAAYATHAGRSQRSAGRLWLIAGLCSSLVYLIVWMK